MSEELLIFKRYRCRNSSNTKSSYMKSHTVSFLKQKIPVLLEKPISDNIKSAKKIIDSSKKNKTPLTGLVIIVDIIQ